MPFKTRYGSHYHMAQGCHGATIPCGTEGLTPCSDCCGGTGDGQGRPSGGGSPAGGSPGMSEGSYPMDDEGSPSRHGLSGSSLDDTGGTPFRQIEMATEAVEVGMQAMESGIRLPDGVTASDMAEALRDTGQPWRRRLDDGEIARGFDRDSSLLDASVAELRRANGHTAAILDEVSSHMKGLSKQLRESGDVDREHSVRMLRLDAARLEQDVDYMRQFVDEDGHTADLAADVARRLRESIRRLQ